MSNIIGSESEARFSDVADPATPATEDRIIVSGRQFAIDVGLVVAWVLCVDWLIYQVGTYLAWGILFLIVVSLLAILRMRIANLRGSSCLAAALVLLGFKLVWSGSALHIACGFGLLICYSMALAGYAPFMPEALTFIGQVCAGATQRVRGYRFTSSNTKVVSQPHALSIVLPIGFVICFSTLFVLANPDLATGVGEQLRAVLDSLGQTLRGFHFGEALLWFVSGFALLGLLYPARAWLIEEQQPVELAQTPTRTEMYSAYRNTLASLIVLFAVYLVFDFATLWFRKFPENFYYAGYAHRGAFWLTAALALATMVLSSIFRGAVLADERLRALKRLAVIWSIENLLLSAAVYNRLLIYIDFNGMTRMRVIGLLGITAVVAGFILVVVKLYRDRGFVWLIHRQLWVPAIAVFLYAVLPVDWLVNRYNVGQIQSGNLAPAVQIISQPVSSEGILPLVALVDCADPKIRDGVRALLALWAADLNTPKGTSYSEYSGAAYRGAWISELNHKTPWLMVDNGFSKPGRAGKKPWHDFQLSNYLLQNQLASVQPQMVPYLENAHERDLALEAFFKYAYQWY